MSDDSDFSTSSGKIYRAVHRVSDDPAHPKESMSYAEFRQVKALERIADALEKLVPADKSGSVEIRLPDEVLARYARMQSSKDLSPAQENP